MAQPQELLLPRVATGDPGAVRLCIERFSPLVWSLARRMLADRADAEDAVQEIFIHLWEVAGRFDVTVASEETFVAMIARRRLIDRRRKLSRAPQVQVLPEDNAVAISEPNPIEQLDEVARVKRAMSALKADEKQALELSIYNGWPHAQIADHLGQPLGTVKTNIRRGLIRIRELLGRSDSRDSLGVAR